MGSHCVSASHWLGDSGRHLTSLCLGYLICYQGQGVMVSTSGVLRGPSEFIYTQCIQQHLVCESMCVHPDTIFQEDYLSLDKFSSMCQGPLFELYRQSWFTHKRLGLEETEPSTGQQECLSMCLSTQEGTGGGVWGAVFPGLRTKFLA